MCSAVLQGTKNNNNKKKQRSHLNSSHHKLLFQHSFTTRFVSPRQVRQSESWCACKGVHHLGCIIKCTEFDRILPVVMFCHRTQSKIFHLIYSLKNGWITLSGFQFKDVIRSRLQNTQVNGIDLSWRDCSPPSLWIGNFCRFMGQIVRCREGWWDIDDRVVLGYIVLNVHKLALIPNSG